MTTLQEDFKLIDIEHGQNQKLKAEIALLRILLSEANGSYISTKDRYEKSSILERHKDLAEQYEER